MRNNHMRTGNKKGEITIGLIKLVLVGLTALAFIKSIWVSLDIDESYAVALGYRLVRGDRLIRDMWEPHQLSALPAALFAAPYIWIRGNTDYLVVYLRVVGMLIHSVLGLALYRQLGKNMNRLFAFGIMILHLNFLPKWVQSPEFELIHYWCLLGVFLALYAYYTKGGGGVFLPVLGGCLFLGGMLCYPTMLLVYPFYALSAYLLEGQYCGARGRGRWRSCLLFTIGAFLAGAALLAWLFSYMSPADLGRYISYIFLDTSHGVYTMGEKWTMYLEQLRIQLGGYKDCLLPAAGIALAVCVIYGIATLRKRPRGDALSLAGMRPALPAALLLAAIWMQAEAAYGCIFEDRNQFFLQFRYMAILLPALVLGVRYHRHMALWLWLCVIPGFLSVPAVLFVTNMDTNVTYSKAFLGVLGSLVIFYNYGSEKSKDAFWRKAFPVLNYVLAGAALGCLLVCRLVLIRVSGCLPVTVLAPLERMEEGPGKGIYVLEDTARIWNDNFRELAGLVDREDRVLYIGADSLAYVGMEAVPSTPSTQGTVVYNEMFLYYYKEHPDRIPNVVVFDKSYAEDPAYALAYGFSVQSNVLFQWVEENYGDGARIETKHLIILKRP